MFFRHWKKKATFNECNISVGGIPMSVIVVGGHCRMHREYKKICRRNGCKAKVYTQMPAQFQKKLGHPDGIVLFTHPVSHGLAKVAIKEARKKNIPVVRCHNASLHSLERSLKSLPESCMNRLQ